MRATDEELKLCGKNMNEYEKQRALNVKKNNEMMIALKLPTLAAGMTCKNPKKKGKEKVQGERKGGDDDYVPGAGEEQSGNNALENPLKVCRS